MCGGRERGRISSGNHHHAVSLVGGIILMDRLANMLAGSPIKLISNEEYSFISELLQKTVDNEINSLNKTVK